MDNISFQTNQLPIYPYQQQIQNNQLQSPNNDFKNTFTDAQQMMQQEQNIDTTVSTPSTKQTDGSSEKYVPTKYKIRSLDEFRQLQQRLKQQENYADASPDTTPHPNESGFLGQVRMYRHDQLLSNPGGDYYINDNGTITYDPDTDLSSFTARVGKDIADSMSNFSNALKDIGNGAEYSYVDVDGKIATAKKTGLLGTMRNFVGNVIDAFKRSPQTSDESPNVLQKLGHIGKKVILEGVVNDLILGIPKAVIDISEDTLLGVLNAIEVIPDATIGNTDIGRKITTGIFDNGQVVVDYITDVMPSGEAWLRTHSAGSRDDGLHIPVLYNITTPEQGLSDLRWAHVRNTPFRKTIETVGSIVADISFKLFPHIVSDQK